MTKKECFLRALRNEPVERVVWAPNFDYWYNVNNDEGTLPEEFRGMSRNDIVRRVGGTIWARVSLLREEYDGVRVDAAERDGEIRTVYRTPLGEVDTLHVPAEGKARAKFLKEHRIKKREDIRVVKYILEATRYVPELEQLAEMTREVGEDGITLCPFGCVPFIQFAKIEAGWINGIYLWTDCRSEVDELVRACEDRYAEGYEMIAGSAVPVVATGDNMDGTMMNPELFREYAAPFYRRIAGILHRKGKIFEAHWCGRTQELLPLVPGTGLDVVEAIVTRPMADLTVSEALDKLAGKVVMQGGLPSVLMCREGCGREEFAAYVKSTLDCVRGRKGFILGMADNVPPNADFERVRMVSDMVEGKSHS